MTIQSRYERIYSKLPDPVSGYELDPNNGYFSVIIPEATTNLVTNPSVEGAVTTNYAAQGGAMAATYNWQAYGSCGLALTPAVSTESGFYFGSATAIALAAGTTYTASVTIQGEEGKVYYIWIGSTAGALIGTKAKWIGTGHKQRIWVTTVEPTGASRRIYVTRDGQYTDQNVFYADGLQLEAKPYPTTYCDGDQLSFVSGQVAYRWTGYAHSSTSTRSAQTRSGGREMKLLWYAFRVLAIIGLGMAPVIDQALPIPGYGEMLQGTGTTARTFTLVGSVIGEGSSGRHLQQLRSSLINAFKPDLTQFDQPLILRYQKCDEDGNPQSESLDILCTYAGGLEGNWDNHQQERIALNFKMHIPFIRNTYNGGIELGYQTQLTNVNYIAMRGSDGVWAKMAAGCTGGFPNAIVGGMDGFIYVGGNFTDMDGKASTAGIAYWNGTAWGAVGTGVTAGANKWVLALAIGPDGALYAGGSFTGMGGIAGTAYIAKWNGTTWTPLGAGANGSVYSLVFGPNGHLYAGGSFTLMDGVAGTARIAEWDGAAWTPLSTGASDIVRALAASPDGSIYAGGDFTNLGGANGDYIAKWNGSAWVALSTGMNNPVRGLAVGLDGKVYAGGTFTLAGGVTASYIARWNGVIWDNMGGGVDGNVRVIYTAPNGEIYVGGSFDVAGGNAVPDSVAIWNGSFWRPLDIDFPGVGLTYVDTVFYDLAGNFYVGFENNGTAYSATVIIPNTGSSMAYPTFFMDGPGKIWQIINYSTGKRIYFNDLTLLAGERVYLCLEPDRIEFVSSFRGNLMPYISPGSDLDFPLLPGNNNISTYFFGSTTANTAITMSWVNVYWSVDGALFE